MQLNVIDKKTLNGFPSGSGIEFWNDCVYIVGDDARDVVVYSKKWQLTDRISIFPGAGKRIPKREKADLEATTLVDVGGSPHLLALGSGSRDLRNRALLLNLRTQGKRLIDVSEFYRRLLASDIEQLNIEGAAIVGDRLILANRGNKTHPDNQLFLTSPDFYKHSCSAPLQRLDLTLGGTAKGAGVSGLAYSNYHDWLCLTASTEDTGNSYVDGPIGNSYLGVIFNASQRMTDEARTVACDVFINLPAADRTFSGQKIESLCIQKETERGLKLHLVADNDTGKTFLFKVKLTIEEVLRPGQESGGH